VWPAADVDQVSATKISNRRNADHWRVRHGDESIIVRFTSREGSARRIVRALTALQGQPFAPELKASSVSDDGTQYIAMEDLGGVAPTPRYMQDALPVFVGVIKALHLNTAFQEAVGAVGRPLDDDSSLNWAEGEWACLEDSARGDSRFAAAAGWMEKARTFLRDEIAELMVCGHGDLHAGNWRVRRGEPALIDWEEIRQWPLASELADFIVFGELDPARVTDLYGAPSSYARFVREQAATCALSFYLYWLRTGLDGSDVRWNDFEQARAACERLFSVDS
jgi:aminoglycoside phosphotransferase (APT) family kinase protein